jgi:hypothetical protein
MAVASGSLAYLGAARFQGYWNAYTNAATGSGYPSAPSGVILALFSSGSSSNPGGYSQAGGGASVTASAGDYWQVTGAANPGGTNHNVDGETDWSENDWIIYSASAGVTDGTWIKLAYEDTIASIVVGDLSGTETFHLTGSADKHVLFISGSNDTETVMSGSDTLTFRYATPEGASPTRLFLTGNLHIADNNKVIFGAGNDASFRYDEDGTDTLLYAGASVRIPDDVKLQFGDAGESHIEYNENEDNYLTLSGTTGVVISGSTTVIDSPSTIELRTDTIWFGEGSATDPHIRFVGGSGNGTLSWDSSEDYFKFQDDVLVQDDEKLYFGTNKESYIKYDEASHDYLVISGSVKGVVISGSMVEFPGKAQITGTVRVGAGYLSTNATDGLTVAAGAADDAHLSLIYESAVSNGFGSSNTAGYQFVFDGGLNALLLKSGHSTATTTAMRFDRVIAQASSSITAMQPLTASEGFHVLNNRKIYVGNHAHTAAPNTKGGRIECDTQDDYLHLSGAKGVVLSGSVVAIDAPALVYLKTDLLTMGEGSSTDPKLGFVHTSATGYIEWDGSEDSFRFLDDIIVNDDEKLHFGTAKESYIQYRETTDDYLVISGSANGVAVSGSTIVLHGDVLPNADNVDDLGSAAKRWANIYTGDLHLRNERGDWTIVEEEDYLCVVNNKTSKKYKMMLQELEEE